MVNLHITRGELADILIEKLLDNSQNSRGLPGGVCMFITSNHRDKMEGVPTPHFLTWDHHRCGKNSQRTLDWRDFTLDQTWAWNSSCKTCLLWRRITKNSPKLPSSLQLQFLEKPFPVCLDSGQGFPTREGGKVGGIANPVQAQIDDPHTYKNGPFFLRMYYTLSQHATL